MNRPCKIPPLAKGFYEDDAWRLVGHTDLRSEGRILLYLESVGTAAEWAAVGLPIRFDRAGMPVARHVNGSSYHYVLVPPVSRQHAVACTDVRAIEFRCAPGAVARSQH
jgi:hypothetical protein